METFSDPPEGAKHLVEEWPGIAKLYEMQDGTLFVLMHAYRADIWLKARSPGMGDALPLCQAFAWVLEPTCAPEIIVQKLRDSLGVELKPVFHDEVEGKELSKVTRSVLEKVRTALAMFTTAAYPAHGNTAVLTDRVYADGTPSNAPVEMAVLEAARELIHTTRRLPTKSEVRAKLLEDYPGASRIQKTRWTSIWKSLHLSGLPTGIPWSAPSKKRGKSGSRARRISPRVPNDRDAAK